MSIEGINPTTSTDGVGASSNQQDSSSSAASAASGLYNVVETNTSDLVDFSNGLRKAKDGKIDTLEELNALLIGNGGEDAENIRQQIAALENQLATLNQEIAQQEENIRTAQRAIDAANTELQRLRSELANEESNYASLEDRRNQLISEQEDLSGEIRDEQNELASISEDINKETQAFAQNSQDEQNAYIDSLKEDYNEEEDGPWEEYVAKKLASYNSASSTSTLTRLNEDAAALQSSITSKTTQLSNITLEIENVTRNANASSARIAELRSEIETNENIVAAETANITNYESVKAAKNSEVQSVNSEIDAQNVALNAALQNYGGISEEEWAVVQEKGIDLSATLPDGSPKYIIAAGKSDNKFHIYDMSQNGASVVRQFADGQGFDIIASGNGYMNGYQDVTGTGQGSPVYSVSSEGGCLNSSCACYTTCSPLSFDLEGDGIKTGVIITYDIDGDGQLDKINDSQDAILVFDKDGDGISGEDGSETFGDNTDLDGDGKKDGFSDGFAALKAYAAKFGLVSANDHKLDENDLKILEEKGLKIKTDGYNSEGKSLLELGITEINLAQTTETTMIDNFDGNGNQLMTQEGATFVINGQTRQYADLWHVKHDESVASQGAVFGRVTAKSAKYEAKILDSSKYHDELNTIKSKNTQVFAQSNDAIVAMRQMLRELEQEKKEKE